MLSDWQFIGIFALIAAVFPGAPILIARFISPRKPNPIKQQTYECGIETVGDTWIQFKVQYYIYALVFVIFDIEAVFLFPIAAAYDELALFAVFEVVLFVLILAVGLAYAWRKGALEWF
jgi:NADH:ubiquinone oxidoreductase subunit 3 (subunit A)